MKIKNKTIDWFKGQILLEIKGFGKDRLINICKNIIYLKLVEMIFI